MIKYSTWPTFHVAQCHHVPLLMKNLALFFQLGPHPMGTAGGLLAGLAGDPGWGRAHHRAGSALQRLALHQLVERRTPLPDWKRPGLQREPQPEG